MANALGAEGLTPATLPCMANIILRREGRVDEHREIDEVNPAVPQHIVLSEHEREAYYFDGALYDEAGSAVYLYQGTEEKRYPKINGSH